jgi:phasin family protein
MTDQTEKKAETPTTATAAATPAPQAAKVETKTEAKPAATKPAAAPKARRAKAVRAATPATRRKPARKATKRAATAAARAATISTKPVRAKSVSTKRKAQPALAAALKTEGTRNMTKTIDTGLFAADQLKTVFGDVNQRAKATAERSAKVAEELADLTRGNVEALVASSKVAAKGVERLSQDVADYSRRSFEEASTALKSVADIKSPTDLFRLQGDFARTAFDSAVAESARFSEAMLKIAGDVVEPITSRYTVAAERAKTLAA